MFINNDASVLDFDERFYSAMLQQAMRWVVKQEGWRLTYADMTRACTGR